MVFDMIVDWLGMSVLLDSYPGYAPLAYVIAGVFALLCTNIFWCVLSSFLGCSIVGGDLYECFYL